jgi:hypothetical protein
MEGVQKWVGGLALTIKEEDGKYVLTKDQLETLLNRYRGLLRLLKKLMDERQTMELLLVEHRLKKLGITNVDGYLN